MRLRIGLFFLFLNTVGTPLLVEAVEWPAVVRAQPYRDSLGMAANLATIRRWVLLSEGYCETAQRHILFDHRARFLTWMDNEATSAETQNKLNQIRQRLFNLKKVERWLPGSSEQVGFPFALSCDQPHADVDAAISRLLARSPEDRLWGTWDGISVGTAEAPVSLFELVSKVFSVRQSQFGQQASNLSLRYLLAQLIVESGGHKESLSRDSAIGILQLKPEVLADCGIEPKFYRHRMAQVDCAARLYVLNERNLRPIFEATFNGLADGQKDRLFSLLLMQSYHSGIGAMRALLQDEPYANATHFFTQAGYSAEDTITGMLYHNLGRPPWGWSSLYYAIDIQIVADALCEQPELTDRPLCKR